MNVERDNKFDLNYKIFCSDFTGVHYLLSGSVDVKPRRYWNYRFNENDVTTVISKRKPYIELYIESTKPWTHKHICYIRAKLEYYERVVMLCLQPLQSQMYDVYAKCDVDSWRYPMISLFYTERLGLDSCRMLFDLSMHWQQLGIPHSFCFADNRERKYDEILWERPDPLTPNDFVEALNRSDEIYNIDRGPLIYQSECNENPPTLSSDRTLVD